MSTCCLVVIIKSFWKSRNLFSKRFLAAGGIKKYLYSLTNGMKLNKITTLRSIDKLIIKTGEAM
jgi:hypothetical protein